MVRPLAAAAVAFLLACSDRAPPSDAAPRPREKPLSRDGSVAREVTSTPDRARVQVDLATVRAALRTYRAERAAWPATLAELSLGGIAYPADLAYDPSTGTVTSRAYPAY